MASLLTKMPLVLNAEMQRIPSSSPSNAAERLTKPEDNLIWSVGMVLTPCLSLEGPSEEGWQRSSFAPEGENLSFLKLLPLGQLVFAKPS